MQFRNQSFFAHVFNLIVQVFFATTFSIAHGAYWIWICPAFMLVIIPMAKKRSWVVVDQEGVHVGDTRHVLWAEVESVAKRGWARVVFVLKDGGRKSLWISDWPTERKEEFYELLQKRDLNAPTAGQDGTKS